MSDWIRSSLARGSVKPLLADIRSGRVRSAAVLLAIQQLPDSERRQIKPALDLVLEAIRDAD